jgi:signal transduction histidine kinase
MLKNNTTANLYAQSRSDELRLLFLDKIWRSLFIMAVIAVPISVSRYFYTGWQNVFAIHVLFLVLVTGTTILHHRLPYDFRALLALVLLDLTALFGVFSFGLLGSAWWWLFLAGMLAGNFYSRRVELYHHAMALLIMAIAGYGFASGKVILNFDANAYIAHPASWLTLLSGPVLFTILVFHAARTNADSIKGLLNEIDQNRKEKAELAQRLEQSMAEIKTLHGFIPICAHCKKIRDDKGYWDNVEAYVQAHSDAKFTHLLCPPCGEQLYGDLWKEAMSTLKPQ